MSNLNFDKYLQEKIKSKPKLKEELEKVDRAVEIAYQIYTLRKKSGLTQSQLAKKIGVSQSNIARIENADYNHYTMRTLDKVAKGLGADLNIFINPPEQTNNLISVINSYPTIQSFVYAGTAGGYFVSGSGTLNREEAINLGVVNGSEEVKVSAESEESDADINKFYYPTLWR